MRNLKRPLFVGICGASLVVLAACSNSGIPWNDGPGWRLSGSPTSIPPPPPVPREGMRPQVMNAHAARKAPQGQQPSHQTIVVEQGDTLTAIATRHRTSISALMAVNNLTDVRVTPGQQLIIPSR